MAAADTPPFSVDLPVQAKRKRARTPTPGQYMGVRGARDLGRSRAVVMSGALARVGTEKGDHMHYQQQHCV